jgi:predicted alpha/beta hydrolase family esterase
LTTDRVQDRNVTMTRHVLFIHGAGTGAHEADDELAGSLRRLLGPSYEICYPAMPDEADADYETWKDSIAKQLAASGDPVVLVGHSVGASILAKCMAELTIRRPIAGMFLIAAPFWGGDGWRYDGYDALALPDGAGAGLPETTPMFLYHSRDDAIVPFAHLALYAKRLPHATIRELDRRGHQLNNDLSEVARDIASLPR